MKLMKTYLDTSVIGAIFDTEDPNRVEQTKYLLSILKDRDGYVPFISNILIEEIERAPIQIRSELEKQIKEMKCEIIYENKSSINLVSEYIKKRIVSNKYREDARHLAIAVIQNMDLIVTWNCVHMANYRKKRMIWAVNLMLGYDQIDIVTPLEVIGHD